MGILDIIFIQKSREEVGRIIVLNWLQVASSAEVINGHILAGPKPLELLTGMADAKVSNCTSERVSYISHHE